MDISANSPNVWLEILGVYLRRRSAFPGNGTLFQTAWVRRGAGLWNDGNGFLDQPESSLARSRGNRWKNSAGSRVQTCRRRRDSGARRKCFLRLLGRRASPGGKRIRMVENGRPGRAGRARKLAIPRPQEKRNRHARGIEHLS